MDENKYAYLITFLTELGATKLVRITGADKDLPLEDMNAPMADMIAASIFDRGKVGRLTNVKSLVMEEISHTVYEF